MVTEQRVVLEEELKTYKEQLPSMLKKHEGQYVIIRGNQIIGYRRCHKYASMLGYAKVGLEEPFLLKQVVRDEEPILIFLDAA